MAKLEDMDSVSSGCQDCDCCYLCFKDVVLRAETWGMWVTVDQGPTALALPTILCFGAWANVRFFLFFMLVWHCKFCKWVKCASPALLFSYPTDNYSPLRGSYSINKLLKKFWLLPVGRNDGVAKWEDFAHVSLISCHPCPEWVNDYGVFISIHPVFIVFIA